MVRGGALLGLYLRYSLSCRDLEEMMAERGTSLDHSTIARCVLRCAPELSKRIRGHLRHPGSSWRVDESYVRVWRRVINVNGHPARIRQSTLFATCAIAQCAVLVCGALLAISACIRFVISAGATSSLWVATDQECPNGSFSRP